MTFIHERQEWPKLRWSHDALAVPLAAVRHDQGRLLGRMESLGFPLQMEATLAAQTEEVVKSSEIEGATLPQGQVRSSIARRLGLDAGALASVDRNVEGVVEMTLDATQRFTDPLTEQRLFAWHAALFPTGRSGMRSIAVGAWRNETRGPMQVVSGPVGRERVHFEAPPARRLATEMSAFLDWFNHESADDPVLRAALAHFWFVTIHPFEDGNGRIARAIADMALARAEGTARRFYSMSAKIRAEREEYYGILERSQKGSLDVTPWMQWFLACLGRAIGGADAMLAAVLGKARFWQSHGGVTLNERQRKMVNLLLNGFEGKLTTTKWAKLAKCSQDTALRDIDGLISAGILVKEPGGGRSTSYALAAA